MKLEEEVIAWAKQTRPVWQLDALRRLYFKGTKLDDVDYVQLFRLMKVEHGFQDDTVDSPEPLDLHHIPSTPDKDKLVGINSVSELQNVNRIIDGQALNFICPGITIVYGANASGKSGYARVLKKACRARDSRFRVLPDVMDNSSHDRRARATIVAIDDRSSVEIDWIDDETSSELLSNVSVFDSGCASVYLQGEQDIAYLPYLLQVVEALANDVIPELKSRLQAALDDTIIDFSSFEHLQRDTEVGMIIQTLDEETDLDTLRMLGQLSDEEHERLQELRQILSAPDPEKTARELRRSAGRIRSISDRLRNVQHQLSSQWLQRIEDLMRASQEAKEAFRTAAETLSSDEELLPGTGNDPWKTMYIAARNFAVQYAYPESDFPHVEEETPCPLCQQPLKSSAINRLRQFEEFVFQETSEQAERTENEFLQELDTLRKSDLSLNIESELAEELEELDNGINSVLRGRETKMEKIRAEVVAGFERGQSPEPIEEDSSVVGRLRSIAAQQLKRSLSYFRSSKPEKSEEANRELKELEDRKSLSQCINNVVKAVETLRKKKKLQACERDLSTRDISNKSKDLGNRLIDERLQEALDEEFRNLAINHIRTKLKTRNDRGQTLYQVTLHSANSVPLTNVLSEGEQRALALAAFFAELKLSQHNGAVVFDDPVTSLDHFRRLNLANRMLIEAKQRQVILFTHDSVFLSQLLEEVERQSVQHQLYFLEWHQNKPGKVNAGLPWIHQNYRERIDQIEKDAAALSRNWPTYPSEANILELCKNYSRLRATIERVVQDVILNRVVQRYNDYIKVKNLQNVIGFNSREFTEIYSLYDKCSGVVEAHDHPTSKNTTPASAHELRDDIQHLNDIIKTVKQRQKNVATT